MMKAAMFIFLDATRRHSRIYSRSSGSIPAAIFALAPEVSRLAAEPHQPEPAVLAAAADVLAGNSFSWPELGRGPLVNVIEASAALAAARSVADRLSRRFDFSAGTGAFNQSISQPHTSQAPHVAHFGFSPKCRQICRCRQPADSTKLRIM